MMDETVETEPNEEPMPHEGLEKDDKQYWIDKESFDMQPSAPQPQQHAMAKEGALGTEMIGDHVLAEALWKGN